MTSARPFVTITEQPAGKLQRFRYLSEVDGARSVGSIPGVNSTPDRKTYPAIHVHGHKGPFLVLLSLLNPVNNLVHPHAITGSDPRYQCRQGVIYVITDGPDVVFKNIGILCVKGKTENDVKMALKNRKRMNVDPFEAGFQHINDHRLIDFTAVRLCFQVFLPGPDWTPADLNNPQKYTRSLAPVASDVVYDAKKLNDLKITFINSCGGAGPVTGGHEMTLLCEKYTGQNPDVVFEDEHGWSQTASIELYHKQLAIVFRTPPYREDRDPNSTGGYKVNVYLQQSTERGVQRSQPATLYYLPNDQKGNPHKLPTTLQLEKPSISLKQVRIQQRPSPGNSSPEEARLKRWRPWGRSDAPPDPSATDSDVDHLHSQIDNLDKIASKHNDNDGRSDAIPLFDPEKSDLYTHEWIRKIEQLGAIHNWSDTVKSYYMQTRLSGIAKVWLSSLRNIDHMTWEEWTKKLLEAFPRKVDYAELIEEMLARRKIIPERSQYYYNKHALRSRLEMNAKKAYACLIEGVPLQMMTPALYDHYETHGYLHPEYHLDIEDPRINARQIEPININITNHKYGTAVQDRKIINFNGADYSFGTNGQEDNRRVCCCCKEEKPRVIRHCSPSRQNEIRPSCIQLNQRRPVLEKSWHKPCSTITSSSSSPSLGNLAPDWLTDENSGVPGNHSV